MKKLRLFSVLLCGFALLALNSCLDSDDDYVELTAEQKEAQFKMVQGLHYGRAIYVAKNADNPQDQTDTLECTFNIGIDYDTENDMNYYSLYIQDLPISVIAENMGSGEQKEAMKTALDVPLRSYIDFVYSDNAAVKALWYIIPAMAEVNLNYGGSLHKLQVYFDANYCQGAYGTVNNSEGSKKDQVQIILTATGIYEDNKLTAWLQRPVTILLEADVY